MKNNIYIINRTLSLNILFLLLINTLKGFSQNVDSLYLNDEIYVKLMESQPIQKPTENGNEIQIQSIGFLKNLAFTSIIQKVELSFYFSDNPLLLRTYRIKVNKPEQLALLIDVLKKDKTIEYVERIPKSFANDLPNDNSFPNQYNVFNAIGMNQVWNDFKFSPDAYSKVAIVDNAVQTNHIDLSANIYSSYNAVDMTGNSNPPNSSYSHGTHVAGIAGAVTNNSIGVSSIGNNIVKIIGIRASGSNPNSISHGYEGISWAANYGVHIINCSFGSYIFSQTQFNVIQDAYNRGVLIVAAAGNDNISSILYPAGYPNVIAVASSDPYYKSDFSNYGSWVHISAPGASILSTVPFNTYDLYQGTSMASPMVAGLAGLLKGVKPSLNITELKNIITSTADNIDSYNPSYIGKLGAGQINAYKALKTICPDLPVISYSGSTTICEGDTLVLSSNTCSGCSYTWKQNGAIVGTNSPTLNVLNAGNYTIQLTKNLCYTQTVEPITVSALPIPNKPTLNVSPSNQICIGQSVNLGIKTCSGTPYWFENGNNANIVVSPTTTKKYTAFCTSNTNGCSSKKDTTIIVHLIPTTPILNTVICKDRPIKQWEKQFGGSGTESLAFLKQANDGGILMGGFSSSSNSFDFNEESRGGADFWMVKTNNLGTNPWTKRFGGSGTDRMKDIYENANGSYWLFGESNSPISGDKTQPAYGNGSMDYWVLQMDATRISTWQSRIGGDGNEELFAVTPSADGGFILVGVSNSNHSGTKSQDSRGGNDYWIVKIDKEGNYVWDKTYGGTGNDFPYAIAPTSDGGYLIGGHSDSNVDIGGGKKTNSKGGLDFWLIKIKDSDGSLMWTDDKVYGGTLNESLQSILPTSDGGFLLGGFSKSPGNAQKEGSKGEHDYWIVKIDAQGNYIWDKSYGGDRDDLLYSMVKSVDGGYYLGGISASGQNNDKTEPSWGGDDYWVVKVDASGNYLTDKRFGGTDEDTANEGAILAATNDAGYVIGGYSGSDKNGDKDENKYGNKDFWAVKFTDCNSLTTPLCNSQTVTLVANNCNGTVYWSNGATGNSINVTPNGASSYYSNCINNGCTSPISNSVTIPIVQNAITITGIASNGTQQAVQTITSTQIVQNGINATYRAGNSISLNNGFLAQNGATFKAEIGGCSN